MKKIPRSNFESSLIISHLVSIAVSLPFIFRETDFGTNTLILIILLGVVQYGLSYVFLSIGLDKVSPVSASLTSTIEPVLNPLIVALIMGERLGLFQIIGGVLVVGASSLYNLRDAKLNILSEKNT
jgi:drug/metabolite transporter (DMT)-like permease